MYCDARQREALRPAVQLSAAPFAAGERPSTAAPVQATAYATIAQRLLLDPSRNAETPVEPQPVSPPPPPMPALPVYHGRIHFGDEEGTVAIMSVAAGKPHQSIHTGEKIGEFTMLAVGKDGIDLQWRDQVFHKHLEEILDRSHAIAPPAGGIEVGYPTPVVQRPPPPSPGPHGPGEEVGHGIKRCIENDTTPAGTVVGGYQKIDKPGPFGRTCYWESIGGR